MIFFEFITINLIKIDFKFMSILLIFIFEDKNSESFIDNLYIKEVNVFVFYEFYFLFSSYFFIPFFIRLLPLRFFNEEYVNKVTY
jgi:hypothetical protein